MSLKAGAIIGLIIGLIPLITTGIGLVLKIEPNTITMVLLLPPIIFSFVGVPEALGLFIWPVITVIIGMFIGHKLS